MNEWNDIVVSCRGRVRGKRKKGIRWNNHRYATDATDIVILLICPFKQFSFFELYVNLMYFSTRSLLLLSIFETKNNINFALNY